MWRKLSILELEKQEDQPFNKHNEPQVSLHEQDFSNRPAHQHNQKDKVNSLEPFNKQQSNNHSRQQEGGTSRRHIHDIATIDEP